MGDGIWFFLQLLVQGLAVGSVYSLVALGFVLIYKASGVINFAQGELLMLGAYACLAFMVQANLPFWAALGLTIVAMGLVALILERLVLRPLIGEPVISIIMATIGLAAVFKAATAAAWGTQLKSFPAIFPDQPVKLGEVVISQVYIWTFLTAMGLMVAFGLFFKFTRLGVAMRATIALLMVQMLGTITPLFLFPELAFTRVPHAPTLEGQYIIKNIVLVSAAILIGATVRGGLLIADPDAAHVARAMEQDEV